MNAARLPESAALHAEARSRPVRADDGTSVTRRVHRMPFGAERTPDGRTCFRLWAPRATSVVIELHDDAGLRQRMLEPCGDGMFELTVEDAPPGTRYAYRVDDGKPVPDPASRWNPDDVHAPSVVVDPLAFAWNDGAWRGRPWHEAVVYELHVGTFTPEGTFVAAMERLDYLRELGVTAIEIMPVADFFGTRNWGYDGVLLYAPDASYGTPDDLKRFVQSAHAAGLMVILDVVYNHFGPEGNYLPQIAPDFFNPAHQTPWGAAINYDGAGSRQVRDFMIHNALYWLNEYHLDGLRLDAVHAIIDTSTPHIVMEIADTVRREIRDRHVHLVLENDDNTSRYLVRDHAGNPRHATAQWADDVHHCLHVLVTGETDGYYADYARKPHLQLARCLAEGFAYQGDWSPYRREMRGAPSASLPPLAFVTFLQNHDQIGNRAFGDRVTACASSDAVRAAAACLLLSPSPPLLFMGEEFGASTPFQFFCDYEGDLARAVTEGRRAEFSRFAAFSAPEARARIPDPNAVETFERCRLPWHETDEPAHRDLLDFYRHCLAVRARELVPLLANVRGRSGCYDVRGDTIVSVRWQLGNGAQWRLDANLSAVSARIAPAEGRVVFACGGEAPSSGDVLAPWGVRVTLMQRAG